MKETDNSGLTWLEKYIRKQEILRRVQAKMFWESRKRMSEKEEKKPAADTEESGLSSNAHGKAGECKGECAHD